MVHFKELKHEDYVVVITKAIRLRRERRRRRRRRRRENRRNYIQ
jgi:hypothetical protein